MLSKLIAIIKDLVLKIVHFFSSKSDEALIDAKKDEALVAPVIAQEAVPVVAPVEEPKS